MHHKQSHKAQYTKFESFTNKNTNQTDNVHMLPNRGQAEEPASLTTVTNENGSGKMRRSSSGRSRILLCLLPVGSRKLESTDNHVHPSQTQPGTELAYLSW